MFSPLCWDLQTKREPQQVDIKPNELLVPWHRGKALENQAADNRWEQICLQHVETTGQRHGPGNIPIDDKPAFGKSLASAALCRKQEESGFKALKGDDQVGGFRLEPTEFQDAFPFLYAHPWPLGVALHHEN